jgi:hypothetical protein
MPNAVKSALFLILLPACGFDLPCSGIERVTPRLATAMGHAGDRGPERVFFAIFPVSTLYPNGDGSRAIAKISPSPASFPHPEKAAGIDANPTTTDQLS